jgi:hypothetical protein
MHKNISLDRDKQADRERQKGRERERHTGRKRRESGTNRYIVRCINR